MERVRCPSCKRVLAMYNCQGEHVADEWHPITYVGRCLRSGLLFVCGLSSFGRRLIEERRLNDSRIALVKEQGLI